MSNMYTNEQCKDYVAEHQLELRLSEDWIRLHCKPSGGQDQHIEFAEHTQQWRQPQVDVGLLKVCLEFEIGYVSNEVAMQAAENLGYIATPKPDDDGHPDLNIVFDEETNRRYWREYDESIGRGGYYEMCGDNSKQEALRPDTGLIGKGNPDVTVEELTALVPRALGQVRCCLSCEHYCIRNSISGVCFKLHNIMQEQNILRFRDSFQMPLVLGTSCCSEWVRCMDVKERQESQDERMKRASFMHRV